MPNKRIHKPCKKHFQPEAEVHEIAVFRRGKKSECIKDTISFLSALFSWWKELDIMQNSLLNKPEALNQNVYEILYNAMTERSFEFSTVAIR